MAFEDIMNFVLPQKTEVTPHITAQFSRLPGKWRRASATPK